MDRILALLLVAKLALFAGVVGYVQADVPDQAPGEAAEQPVPVQDALVEAEAPLFSEDPRLP